MEHQLEVTRGDLIPGPYIVVEVQALLVKHFLSDYSVPWELNVSIEAEVGLTPSRLDSPADLERPSILVDPVILKESFDFLDVSCPVVAEVDDVPSLWV